MTDIYPEIETGSNPTVENPRPAVLISDPQVNKKELYKTIIRSLGITEIVLGAVLLIPVILNIILIAGSFYFRGIPVAMGIVGLLSALMMITSGTLGVVLHGKPSECMYKANIGMSIATSVILIVHTKLSRIFFFSYANIATDIFSLPSLIICVIHTVYSCKGICLCCGPNSGDPSPSAQLQQVIELVPISSTTANTTSQTASASPQDTTKV